MKPLLLPVGLTCLASHIHTAASAALDSRDETASNLLFTEAQIRHGCKVPSAVLGADCHVDSARAEQVRSMYPGFDFGCTWSNKPNADKPSCRLFFGDKNRTASSTTPDTMTTKASSYWNILPRFMARVNIPRQLASTAPEARSNSTRLASLTEHATSTATQVAQRPATGRLVFTESVWYTTYDDTTVTITEPLQTPPANPTVTTSVWETFYEDITVTITKSQAPTNLTNTTSVQQTTNKDVTKPVWPPSNSSSGNVDNPEYGWAEQVYDDKQSDAGTRKTNDHVDNQKIGWAEEVYNDKQSNAGTRKTNDHSKDHQVNA
ncbi:hypothetical protein BD289DRAFT_450899 [Coniella lustricola]|uniref:Uncharacterized protein n=1 Tax=Coniella lustricola TaxID=2025994 RepID=A0A2T3AGP6_9PEZI|nr:hypothetical protein BD289DRAFT_450899 [Coniella lustricola]